MIMRRFLQLYWVSIYFAGRVWWRILGDFLSDLGVIGIRRAEIDIG
jgi:hypothetical protein